MYWHAPVVPEPWVVLRDEVTVRRAADECWAYVHVESGEVNRGFVPSAPEGWRVDWSPAQQSWFWRNVATGEATLDPPERERVAQNSVDDLVQQLLEAGLVQDGSRLTCDVLKKLYRRVCLENHPDRRRDASGEEQHWLTAYSAGFQGLVSLYENEQLEVQVSAAVEEWTEGAAAESSQVPSEVSQAWAGVGEEGAEKEDNVNESQEEDEEADEERDEEEDEERDAEEDEDEDDKEEEAEQAEEEEDPEEENGEEEEEKEDEDEEKDEEEELMTVAQVAAAGVLTSLI